jgi:HSP20 family protein
MALIRWEPFRDIDPFFDEDFFSPLKSLSKIGWDLASDVYEKNGNFVVEMNLPGIDPEKLDISVKDNYLRVSGSREEEKEQKGKNYYSKEIKRGSFERTVRLPGAVKKDAAEAGYHDGVLQVTIPKEEAQKSEIKVKVKK